jgi:hypothetical protein
MPAQDAIELGEAQKAARKLAASATAITDAPFSVEVDREKPQGIKAKDGGLIVLPDRKLSRGNCLPPPIPRSRRSVSCGL